MAAALLAGVPGGVAARTLTVGPGQAYPQVGVAVREAAAGDTISIEPGTYYDCAVATVPLTIEGHGPGVILTDRTCEEKAILVLRGGAMVVRDVTLARARVGDGNGAGIRMEGQGLTLERVVFDNDEVGLLAAPGPGRITVTDCAFLGGGVDGEHPLAALFVDRVAALVVRHSRFSAARGAQVNSAAELTEFHGNTVETGAAARGLDIRGALVAEDNSFAAGRRAAPGMLRVEGDGPVVLRRNRLMNHAGGPATLLLDWTGGAPTLAGNVLIAGDQEVSTDGVWRHRASATAHGMKDGARAAAGQLKRGVLGLVR